MGETAARSARVPNKGGAGEYRTRFPPGERPAQGESSHASTHEQGSNPQVFGETTAEFVRRQRLEFAQELLRSSELQVQQIARRAGYAHHGSFTAAFTRQFGHSPKKVSRAITSDPGT
jgi:methylphosphotriester-DNA--protein-cysteine methyltransferase